MAQTTLASLDNYVKPVENWFLKLPALPKGVKDFIVVILPWIALIFGAIGLLGSLAALGFGAFLSPLIAVFGGVSAVGQFSVAVVIGLITSLLSLLAVKALFARKIFGWRLIFWSEVLSLVATIVAFSLVGIIFAIVWFYVLFQIKGNYK